MPRAICLLVVAFPLSLCVSHADVHVIDPYGTGDYPTIQAAVDAAVNGDVIELTDGIFTGAGNCDIDLQGKLLTTRSASGDASSCVVDCAGEATGFLIQSGGSNFREVFEYITIRNASVTGVDCISHSGTFTGCIFTDCKRAIRDGYENIVHGCVFEGCTDYAVNSEFAGYGEYVDCIFRNNEFTAVYLKSESRTDFTGCCFIDNHSSGDGGAVRCHSTFDADFVGCSFIRNSSTCGGAIYYSGMERVELTNCTLYANAAPIASGIFTGGSVDGTVALTIIANGVGGQAVDGYYAPPFYCVDIYGNEGGDWVGVIEDYGSQPTNISLDPLFCDPDADNFFIQDTSPCVPNSPPNYGCAQIGAFPIGCGLSSIWDPAKRSAELSLTVASPISDGQDVRLEFSLLEESRGGRTGRCTDATLRIYDSQGRCVATLLKGPCRFGRHSVTWDGRDANGGSAGGGVYFAKLASGQQSVTRSLIVVP